MRTKARCIWCLKQPAIDTKALQEHMRKCQYERNELPATLEEQLDDNFNRRNS